MSASLLDVNVLVALLDSEHVHHRSARDWFEAQGRAGWATCPIVENGFVRIVSTRRYPGTTLSPGEASELLAALKGRYHQTHRWWPDDVSLTDETLFRMEVLLGANQVTDAYLLGLAFRKGGRVASFDRSLPWQVVRGASQKLVEKIR